MSGDELADALALVNDHRGDHRDDHRTADRTAGAAGAEPSGPDGSRGTAHDGRSHSTHRARHHDWPTARAVAARAGAERRPESATVPLAEALGHRLAAPLTALTDLPAFDTSAMDGWAVSGPGPWELDGPEDGRHDGSPGPSGVLAGHDAPAPLLDGHAVRIATGARVPPGTTAVLRSEYGEVRDRWLRAPRAPHHGADIRPRAQECRRDDHLLPAGTAVTPAVLGLAAAAGLDELPVLHRPRAEVLVLGDELLSSGLPEGGRVRDALGPMVGPWLEAVGAEVVATRRLGDDADALLAALAGTTADLVVTTGGTAAGPVDHVHPALHRLGAELLVDGVAVRPGHPMLLARLPGGAHLVGLPGNPLAAISGLLTLAEPLLRSSPRVPSRTSPGAVPRATPGTTPPDDVSHDLPDGVSGGVSGGVPRDPRHGAPVPLPTARLLDEVQGHPRDTRLVPVVHDGRGVRPLRFSGPAMLRGVATAGALAVVPPGGGATGSAVPLLRLPWV
ncbi:molybdopterin molybdenumtransferase MoeA [Streptomyces sp. TRM43335]|uniref:Molybdopterin molybdenumtransferase n=1 Tax=Streptomyces taklimakanensis TaxID=2569853 RepID=A0A6G2BCU0_9ACTN|nr:molybdopterin-binding protein [Streptomyces taklimakanensis]MTE19946.1 molybdopterin molybdenumtransferase MoeA [Streptomyces taklimakanensis]